MKKRKTSKGTIVLAAGGTGGHIFPAQALAEYLLDQGYQPVLICDDRSKPFLQGALLKIPHHQIFSQRLTGSLLHKVCGISKLMFGLFKVRAFMKKQRPQLVIGFGGYPSFPALAVAYMLGIKSIISEQNAVLGWVNRLVSSVVQKICVTFPDTRGIKQKYRSKMVITGTPVRKEIISCKGSNSVSKAKKFRILVIGGSQGARIFSEVIPQAIALLPEAMQKKISITQQARPEYLEGTLADFKKCQAQVHVEPFFTNINKLITEADIVICRAGASSIAEVATIGKAAILVPYAVAVDNHQFYNALNLVSEHAAIMITEKHFKPRELARVLEDLISSPEKLKELKKNIGKFSQADAIKKLGHIVDECVMHT